MIAFVEGELVDKKPDGIIVSVSGIGLFIDIPMSTFQALGALGSPVRIETVLHTREDGMQLYGFATKEEKQLFEMLISLPGIGPGVALNILSGAAVSEFITAIINEDISKLVSLPKIGKKTAQRLIMELRDKMTNLDTNPANTLPVTQIKDTPQVDDAILGLVALGYEQSEARRQVVRVISEETETQSATEIIRSVLSNQGGH